MRVSSLSDERIIRLVSRHFVPVWVSRDNYQLSPPPKAEQDLVAAIDASRQRKRLEGGTVCVYIVSASGETMATLPVQRACKPAELAPFLDKIIRDQKLTARASDAVRFTAVASKPCRPATTASRQFSIRTRFDERTGNRGTSHDRIELAKKEWQAFLPGAKPVRGDTWALARPISEKLLRLAYPPLPHWDARLAKIRSCNLSATVVSVSAGEVLLRLEGNLNLVYPDKGKPDDGRATARLIGYARCDRGAGVLTSLQLVSEEGKYVWFWNGAPQVKPMSVAIELEP
jgi:hypothetical protein